MRKRHGESFGKMRHVRRGIDPVPEFGKTRVTLQTLSDIKAQTARKLYLVIRYNLNALNPMILHPYIGNRGCSKSDTQFKLYLWCYFHLAKFHRKFVETANRAAYSNTLFDEV